MSQTVCKHFESTKVTGRQHSISKEVWDRTQWNFCSEVFFVAEVYMNNALWWRLI